MDVRLRAEVVKNGEGEGWTLKAVWTDENGVVLKHEGDAQFGTLTKLFDEGLKPMFAKKSEVAEEIENSGRV